MPLTGRARVTAQYSTPFSNLVSRLTGSEHATRYHVTIVSEAMLSELASLANY